MCKNSAKNRVKHNWYRQFKGKWSVFATLHKIGAALTVERSPQWITMTLIRNFAAISENDNALMVMIMPIIMIVITILINMIVKVRLPVCNIDLAYTEEMWGEIKDTKGDGHVKKIIIMSCQHIPIITKSRHGHHHHHRHHHHRHRVIIIVKIIIIIITILPLYCWCMWLAEVLIMTKRNHLEYTHTQFGGDDDHHMRNDDDR